MSASSARQLGDEAHQYLFWNKVSRMLASDKIAAVGYETGEFKAFDDVGIKYAMPHPDGYGGYYDERHIQAKFSVGSEKQITAEALTDPNLINATKVSLLQRLRDAVNASDQTGRRILFGLWAPWQIDPSDLLAKMHRRDHGTLDLDKLFAGKTTASESGMLRKIWADHLGIDMDNRAEFDRIFGRLRLTQEARSFDDIRDELSSIMPLAGLKPVDMACVSDEYCTLVQRLSRDGLQWFSASEIKSICKAEGLWIGKPDLPIPAIQFGIRSFSRFAESLEDRVDALLCLQEFFDDRHITRVGHWQGEVLPRLQKFLSTNLNAGQLTRMHLPVVSCVAFTTGYLAEPKLGAKFEIVQPGARGEVTWSATSDEPSSVNWTVEQRNLDMSADALIVAISISHDVRADVAAFANEKISDAHAVLEVRLDHVGQAAIRDGQHAFDAANQLSTLIKAKQAELSCARAHLFWAAPNSFAFLLGQASRTLGPISLYEFEFGGTGVGRYTPCFTLTPDFRLS
ncbi:SAVED domain-containing protein [Rhodopirellula baltica]|uniref:SMODS-associated and fused to various effectors domain-containing protein n=1 Tax=Rhodopirellula baltica SWK14 TaxID=993516 RepID=L7C882_RHOBT|nr:SAVED domain-containing protein [Rhodopirellula baltica]ELP30248.1 hypothetical protein RBSWK_05846 [Rhodopirellula baltica SWK14]